jgi:DNA-binding NtrC family response regulator
MAEKNVSILIVDDEEDMGWALKNILKMRGYSSQLVTNGAKAIEQLEQGSYQLVFIDARLPDIDGIELSRQIKKYHPEIPLVLISGYFYSDDAVIKDGLIKGLYSAFVGKPFELEEIYGATENILRR